MQQSFSFKAAMWKRLKKNRGALFGLVVIILAVLISIFGYVIAPDNSPNADLQTVEIQAKKPGYSQQFLKIPGNNISEGNWLNHFISGKNNNFQLVPIKGYRINGDSLLINKFIDDDTTVVQYYSVKHLTNNNPAAIQNNIITKKYWLGTD
ncbi:MAG: ABC transporter permease, partial [Ferruginibacter sp.]